MVRGLFVSVLYFSVAMSAAAFPFAAVARGGEEALTCVKDWSVAATIAKDHGLVPVAEIAKKAKAAKAGTIVKTTLCAVGERYVYQVLLRDKDGALKKVRLDSRNPQFLSGK